MSKLCFNLMFNNFPKGYMQRVKQAKSFLEKSHWFAYGYILVSLILTDWSPQLLISVATSTDIL